LLPPIHNSPLSVPWNSSTAATVSLLKASRFFARSAKSCPSGVKLTPAADAIQELAADGLLQFLNMGAYGGLAQRKQIRRLGEAPHFGDPVENLQLV
jgi:hypothetical protein